MSDGIIALSNIKTLEASYFNLRIAILRNNRKNIDYNLELIHKITNFKPSLLDELDPYYLEELERLKEISKSDFLPFSLTDPSNEEDNIMEIYANKQFQFKSEKELKKRLFHEDFEKINKVINNSLQPVGVEIKSNYGWIDILAKKDDEIWIIELKKGRGDHRLTGQTAKYILAYEEKLINKSFKKVKSITIANGYTKFCLQNLKKMGTIPIHYELINKNLILKIV